MRLLLPIVLAALVPSFASAQDSNELGSPALSTAAPSAPRATEVVGLDPELRGTGLRLGRTAPDFGESVGHAFAGFGMGFAVSATTGFWAAFAVCQDGSSDVFMCPIVWMGSALFSGLALAPFSASLAVWGWGTHDGSGGNFFASLGLSYLGAGVGAGLVGIFTAANEPGFGVLIGSVVGLVLSNLGAALGYELTVHDDGPVPSDEPAASPTVQVVPLLAPAEQGAGATAGIAGMF